MAQHLRELSIQEINNRIIYHERAADKHQMLLDYHRQGETVAREELAQRQRQASAPPIAEISTDNGNLVARGYYVVATNEYVTNIGEKVAHWNASLAKIVWVPAVKSKVKSQNIQADPVAHARHLEQGRQRYRAAHPVVERLNRFI